MSEDLRSRAVSNLKAKSHFWQVLVGWVVLSLFFTAIWLFSGASTYFWPIWPIAGVALGVIGTGVRAFGSGGSGPSEDQIQGEMRKLGG